MNYNDDEIVLPLNIYEVLFCLRVLSLENKLFLNSFDRGLHRFGSIVHHFASSSSSCFAYLNGIFNQLVILWLACTYIRIKRQHFSKKWNNKYTNTSSAQILRVVRSDAYQLFVLVLMVFFLQLKAKNEQIYLKRMFLLFFVGYCVENENNIFIYWHNGKRDRTTTAEYNLWRNTSLWAHCSYAIEKEEGNREKTTLTDWFWSIFSVQCSTCSSLHTFW